MNSRILASIAAVAMAATPQVAFAQTAHKPAGGLAVDTGMSNRNYPHSDRPLINGHRKGRG